MGARTTRWARAAAVALLSAAALAAQDGPPADAVDAGTVLVEGGSFAMGSDRYTFSHEGPAHRVALRSFRMAAAELTVGEFAAFVQATGYRSTSEADGGAFVFMVAAGDGFFRRAGCDWRRPNFRQSDAHAAAAVSWIDAVNYCNWRSRRDGLRPAYAIDGDRVAADWGADGWRLPTEAEWEYAARGGRLSKGYRYAGSDRLREVAWASYDSGWATHPGRLKPPNELGLYDMTGNVDEWCWDWYGPYAAEPAADPKGPESGFFKVQRGGNWYTNVELYEDPRNTARDFSEPRRAYNTSGLRLVRNAAPAGLDPGAK